MPTHMIMNKCKYIETNTNTQITESNNNMIITQKNEQTDKQKRKKITETEFETLFAEDF